MTETKMAAAMKQAGVDTPSARLYSEATRLLRAAGGKPERALEKFTNDVLFEPEMLDALALRFLKECAQDMHGMPGEGQPGRADKGQPRFANARQQNGDDAGHKADADEGQLGLARPSPARTLPARPAPREPSKAELSAARQAKAKQAQGVFARKLGHSLSVGGSTRRDWINFARSCEIAGHIGWRMISEIPWPDDKTPLEKVANEKQVRSILDSGPQALRALEGVDA